MAPVFIKRYGKIKGSTVLYGFKIDQRNSDGIIRISYLEDNEKYNPVSLNKTTGVMDYKDWGSSFILEGVKPCMLKYDGTVDYYLDLNDYTKKKNGGDSDNSDINYSGNTMVEFSKIYYKIVDNGDDTADVYISNSKIEDEYKCWSHLDRFGNEIDYCYISAYYARYIDSKLRSIKGQTTYCDKSVKNCEYYAGQNGDGSNNGDYNVMLYCDCLMVQLCALLISRTVNSQDAFGYGYSFRGIGNSDDIFKYDIKSGYLDNKGLFYGKGFDKVTSQEGRVKMFGLEDYLSGHRECIPYGLYCRQQKSGSYYYTNWCTKMTSGMSDGSFTDDYSNYDNYIITGRLTKAGSGIKSIPTKMHFTKYGFFPKEYKTFSEKYDSTGPEFETGYGDYFGAPAFGYGTPALFSYHINNESEYFRKYSGLFYMNVDVSNYANSLTEDYGQRLTCKPARN